MNKKKTLKITAIFVAVALIIILAIISVIPNLKVYFTYRELIDDDYSYEIYYEVTNKNISIGDIGKGKIKGDKNGNKVYASVINDDTEYMKIYRNDTGNIIVNVKPLVKVLMKKANIGIVSLFLDDMCISTEVIEEIFGQDFNELLSLNNAKESKVDISIDNNYDADEDITGFSDMDFEFGKSRTFHVNFDDIQINFQTYDNKLAGYVTIGNTNINIAGYYDKKVYNDVVIPEVTIDKETVDKIREIYVYWKDFIG